MNDTSIVDASIEVIREALNSGALTSVELVIKHLCRVAKYDYRGPCFNAIPILNPAVLEEAAASDDRRAAGLEPRPLEGIPYTVKDSYKVKGLTAASGSPAFKDLISSEDAFTVARLREAGAVLIGKTNMPPMAAGGMQRGVYGRAESPYNSQYLTSAFASGSSNGSATATSSSFAVFGMAEETVSSGRSPASNNGLVAFTPSRGILSIRGNWPLYPTCDVVVPHTRSVSDMLELLNVIAVPDEITAGDFWRDQKFVKLPQMPTRRPQYFSELRDAHSLKGKRLAVPRMYIGHDEPESKHVETRQSVLDLWTRAKADLEALGAVVVETDFPVITNYEKEAFPGQSVNVPGFPEGWNNVERGPMVAYAWDDFLRQNNDSTWPSLEKVNTHIIYPAKDPTDPQLKYSEPQNAIKYTSMSDFITQRIEQGTVKSLLDFPGLPMALDALETTRKRDFEDWLALHNLDAAVFPANGDVGRADADINDDSARHAWKNGVKYSNGNRALRHLGIPTVSVTMGRMHDTGMPVGLTFAGPAYRDDDLLRYAYAYESKSRRREPPPLAPVLDSDAIQKKSANKTESFRSGKSCPVITIDTASRNTTAQQDTLSIQVSGTVSAPAGVTIAHLRAFIDGDDVPVNFHANDGKWSIAAETAVPPTPRWDGRMEEVTLAMESVMVLVLAESAERRASGQMVLL